jgi:hypothetical membrane protein
MTGAVRESVRRSAARVTSRDVLPVPWWALVWCALIPLILTSSWLVAGAMQPRSYDPVRQTVSVLAGHAGAHRWIVTAGLILAGLCYFAAAASLTFLRSRARVGLAVSGGAAVGVGLCPEPVVGTTAQHMLFTSIGAASIAVWPALTSQREASASALLRPPVTIVTTVIFLVMLGWLVAEARGGTVVGLVERLDSSIQIAWPFVVTFAVMAADRRAAVGRATAMSG